MVNCRALTGEPKSRRKAEAFGISETVHGAPASRFLMPAPEPPISLIQLRMSSARQAVTRADSLTGAGNVPASTRRQSVDLEMGTKFNTCACRRKPVSGRIAWIGLVVDMIGPNTGARAGQK